jgi:hypothetical protein
MVFIVVYLGSCSIELLGSMIDIWRRTFVITIPLCAQSN